MAKKDYLEGKPVDLEKDESLDFSSVRDDGLSTKAPKISDEEVLEQDLETPEIDEDNQDNSEEVDKARRHGHLTKEEWVAKGKRPEEWKSPEEFNDFSDWYKDVRKDNAEIKKQNELLIKYRKEDTAKAVLQARQEIEARLRQAKDLGNSEDIEKLTEQRVYFDQIQRQEQQQNIAQEVTSADDEFLTNNKHWFNESNPDLMEAARRADVEIGNAFPNITYREKLKRIETRIKYEYPETAITKVNRPVVSPSRSGLNKSAQESTESYTEDKILSKLDRQEKDDFSITNDMLKRRGIKPYTAKEFLVEMNKFKSAQRDRS